MSRNMGVQFNDLGQLQLNTHRVQALENLTRPARITLHDVHSIRGCFLSFSRFVNNAEFVAHIKNFSDIISACTADKTLASTLWNATHDASFERLKVMVTEAITLYVPDMTRPFYVRSDACNPSSISSTGGWCGMLYQYDAQGKLCPIAIYAKNFTAAQSGWHTKDKECGAIVFFLRYLQRLRLPCTYVVVTTDHDNITHMRSSTDPRTQSWFSELVMRTISFQHLAGAQMYPNDALSRLPTTDSATVTIAALHFAAAAFPTTLLSASPSSTPVDSPAVTSPSIGSMAHIAPIIITTNLTNYIELQSLFSEEETGFMRERATSFAQLSVSNLAMPASRSSHLSSPSSTGASIWVHNGSIVIPAAASDLTSKMVADAHLHGCHARDAGMHALLSHVWWPSKNRDISAYLNSCPQCQVVDAPPRHTHIGYFNIKNPGAADHTHILDHMIMSPTSSAGHTAILTITCAFTRYVWLQPVTSLGATDTLAAAMAVWHESGLPIVAQTDASTSFHGDFQAYCSMYAIDHKVTDAYAPWQNGKGERQHHVIGQKLRKHTLGNNQANWHLALPLIAGVINSSVNRNTGGSAYYLRNAREKRTPATAPHDLTYAVGTLTEWHEAINTVQDALALKNDISSLHQAHIQARDMTVPYSYKLNEDVLLFFPAKQDKLDTFWRPGYRVTDLLPDDDTHCIVSRVEPDGKLYSPERVPLARLRPFDSSRVTHSGARLRINDDRLLVKAIASHTDVPRPDFPHYYTFYVLWEDSLSPPEPARLQDLMHSCQDMLKAYCEQNKISWTRLITQRAAMNKLEKSANAAINVSAYRLVLAALPAVSPQAPNVFFTPTHAAQQH
jgi:hypothetical protein